METQPSISKQQDGGWLASGLIFLAALYLADGVRASLASLAPFPLVPISKATLSVWLVLLFSLLLLGAARAIHWPTRRGYAWTAALGLLVLVIDLLPLLLALFFRTFSLPPGINSLARHWLHAGPGSAFTWGAVSLIVISAGGIAGIAQA